MNQRLLSLTLGILTAFTMVSLTAGAVDPINIEEQKDLAIHGTDPVSYFTDGKPVKGSAQFTAEWMGAKWHFVNQKNRDMFVQNPQKYAPQYGGYCAYGASQGKAVDIDPQAWKIVNNKLYLNHNKKVQSTWLGKPQQFITEADKKWPSMTSKAKPL